MSRSNREHATRFGALAIADLVSKALAFVATPIIIRHYGARAFGELGIVGQMMALALLLGTCGLDTYSVRTIAVSRDRLGRWASTIVLLRLLLGALGYIAVIAIALALPQYRAVAGLLGVAGLSLFTRATYLDWAAQALQHTRIMAAAMITTQAGYLGLVVAMARLQQPLWAMALAQVLAEVATAVWLLWWFHRRVAPLERPLPSGQWRSMLRDSFPFAGGQLLRGVSLGLDLVLLGAFLVPGDEIGWYSGSLKLFQLCSGTVAVYFMIMLPRFSVQASNSGAALRGEIARSLRLIVPLAGIAAIATGLVARPLLTMVGGEASFAQAALEFRILVAAVVVGLIGSHYRNALFAIGRQRLDLRNTAVSTVAHVMLKLALIPLLGMLGAALGTLGGEVALMLVGLWSFRRELSRDEAGALELAGPIRRGGGG